MEALATEVMTAAPAAKRWTALAVATVVLSLSLNAALLVRDDRPLGTDEALHYLTSLEQVEILEGPLSSWRLALPEGALYPPQQYLLGGLAIHFIGGRDPKPILALVDGGFWILLLASVWSIARRAAGTRAAAVAIVFCCTTPLLFTAGRSYFLDWGLTAWISLVMALLMRSDGGRPGRGLTWVLVAVLLALLQKWSAPLYLIGPALGAAGSLRRRTLAERLRAVGAGAATMGVAIVLWSLLTDTERFLSFTGELQGATAAMGLPGPFELGAWIAYGERFVLGNPVGWGHLLVAVLLAVPMIRSRAPGAGWLATWLIGGWIALSVFGRKDPRYLLPVLPALGLWIALGLEALARWRSGWGRTATRLFVLSCFWQLGATVGVLPAPVVIGFEARLEDDVPAPRFDHPQTPGQRWSLEDVVGVIAESALERPRVLVIGRMRVVNFNTLRCELARHEIAAEVSLPGDSMEAAHDRARTCDFILIKDPPREPWFTARTGEREAGRRAALSVPFFAPERYVTRLIRRLPDGTHLTLLERLTTPRTLETLWRGAAFPWPKGEVLASDGRRFVTRVGDEIVLTGGTKGELRWRSPTKETSFDAVLDPSDDRIFLKDRSNPRLLMLAEAGEVDVRKVAELSFSIRWIVPHPWGVWLGSPGGLARLDTFPRDSVWRVEGAGGGGISGPPSGSMQVGSLLVLRGRRLRLIESGSTTGHAIGADDLDGPLLASALDDEIDSAAWVTEGIGGLGDWRFEWFDLNGRASRVRWDITSPMLESVSDVRMALHGDQCAVLTTFNDGTSELRAFRSRDPLPALRTIFEEPVIAFGIDEDGKLMLVTKSDAGLHRWHR